LIGNCDVCLTPIVGEHINPFVEPSAFSIKVGTKGTTSRYRRTSLVRQKQSLTHFIDRVENSSFSNFGKFDLAIKKAGTLFRYNPGPEFKGFILCPECGFSEPARNHKAGKGHSRLRPFANVSECKNSHPWTKPIAYGHKFLSYCLIARPTMHVDSVESLAFALQKGLCNALDLESSDIGVSWRWFENANGKSGYEIVLYDHAPGGAGFVEAGYNSWNQVTEAASLVCQKCTCEESCYDCLKSYGNQSQHDKLDRKTVVAYLK
jgi:hypothetical protein